MTYGEAFDLCLSNAEAAPPGCDWHAWDIYDDRIQRRLTGFGYTDLAVIRLNDLAMISTREMRVKHIRQIQEIACLALVMAATEALVLA